MKALRAREPSSWSLVGEVAWTCLGASRALARSEAKKNASMALRARPAHRAAHPGITCSNSSRAFTHSTAHRSATERRLQGWISGPRLEATPDSTDQTLGRG